MISFSCFVTIGLVYTGKMYGVHTKIYASKALDEAMVHLQGLGVQYTGRAKLHRNGTINLEDSFQKQLHHRRIVLNRIEISDDCTNIEVFLQLSLLGQKRFKLFVAESKETFFENKQNHMPSTSLDQV